MNQMMTRAEQAADAVRAEPLDEEQPDQITTASGTM